jgi:hypothetical protein
MEGVIERAGAIIRLGPLGTARCTLSMLLACSASGSTTLVMPALFVAAMRHAHGARDAFSYLR